MNAADRFFQRWLSTMLFGIWAAALIYLLASQRYTAFLRPGFGLLLALAHFIAMGFMIAALPGERPARLDFNAALRAVVLLVPIIYLMSMPAAMLGSRAFTNRFVGPSGMTAKRADGPAMTGPPTPSAQGMRRSDRELTILDLMLNPEWFDGRRVAFTGMMLHDEQLAKEFGGRKTVVYRFLINCCAADALPLAVAVDSDQAGNVANDQWVRVAGVFHLHQIDDGQVPMVEDAAVDPVEAPSFPYLY
jgi:putative membrane protein